MSKLILTPEEALSIVRDDHDDWKEIECNIVANSRWSIQKLGVFLHIPTQKYYEFGWSIGSTEMQNEEPYEYDKQVEVCEVVEKEVLRKEWVDVED